MKRLDTTGKWFLALCALMFVVGVAFKLHGSSTFIWREHLKDTAAPGGGLLLATPQEVRSDEWIVWTPAVLSQAQNGFAAENPSLGAGKAPFLYSLPVRHYTMVFRPQLYGFFLLDLERGYAWYWNTKVFGLLASMFLLFWTLTRNTTLSLFGTTWLFFSNYVQWWFSCPPMLPDMLASWAVAVVCVVTLLRTARPLVRIWCAALLVVSIVNFALCLYPPFQIPLLYLGVLVVGALIYSDNASSRPRVAWSGILSIGGALAAVAAVLVPFFFELRPTLEILSSTAYPGQRRAYGGELDWMHLFSGLMNLFNSETAFPDRFGQPNEAANFFPLWVPAVILTARQLFNEPRRHAVAIAALAVVVIGSVYALVPLPMWLCNATLLNFCTENRMLLAIGVANVLFVVVTFPLVKQRVAAISPRALVATLVGIACLVSLYLSSSVPANEQFLGPACFVMFFAAAVAIAFAFLKAPPRAFFAGFVLLLAASNALVNPLMMGLDPLLKATPATAVHEIMRRDPSSAWAAYESNPNSEFLMAMGARVVSGVKIVPDLAFYEPFDPDRASESAYNRYSFAYFTLPVKRDSVALRHVGFPCHIVDVHPSHSGLAARGVRYFLFPKPLAAPGSQGMQLLKALPQNRMWIYELAAQTPPLATVAATLP